MSNRPKDSEYSEYFGRYVKYVQEDDIVAAMEASTTYTTDVLESFTDAQAGSLHGTTNWTLKETLGHLCDAERIMSYRAMRISRGDKTPLPGFEQDDYIVPGKFNRRSWEDLVGEYKALRSASLALARSFDSEMAERMGTASDSPVSARALLYIIVGHERRHLEMLKQHTARG
jgi:uncharacterized damage-inducible protein DinB